MWLNNVIKNIKCPLQAKLRTLGFGQPNLMYCLCEGQVDRKISLLPGCKEGDF